MLKNMFMDLIDSSEFRQKYEEYFKLIKIPAHKTLLLEGETAKNIYFLREGCLRMWYNDKGRDITFQFFFEGQPVASIESFWQAKPSRFSIESIEPCTLLVLSKKNFMKIYDENMFMKERLIQIMMGRLENYAMHFLSLIKDTPAERYADLIKKKPFIVQRIPQHYIASYLGITPVSLSRIRNRYNKKN